LALTAESLPKSRGYLDVEENRLSDSASRYGERNGERLHLLHDLNWNWTDAFLAEHPEIDAAGTFDDQEPSHAHGIQHAGCHTRAARPEQPVNDHFQAG
jgi:hypothetical protein